MSNVERGEEKETGRVEAFSDGVFAVAVTLLVFAIPVTHPDPNNLTAGRHLGDVLLHEWPNFAAYVVSFITILVMWINHHSMFQMVQRIDREFLIANGILLLLITFINYPTALVASYILTPDENYAALLYSGTLVLIAILYNWIWRHASHKGRLLNRQITVAQVTKLGQEYRFAPFIYLVAFLLSFVSNWAGLTVDAALAVYFAFTGQLTRPTTEKKDVPLHHG